MPLRYVCGIIKDHFGRYLMLDYAPAKGTGNTEAPNKCTISVESWVSEKEDTLDVLVREIDTTLSIPMLDVLSSLDLRDTRCLKRTGVHCDQELTVYTFLMDGIFRTKCANDVTQRLRTADQINRVIRKKILVPTTYCRFVVENMDLWESVA